MKGAYIGLLGLVRGQEEPERFLKGTHRGISSEAYWVESSPVVEP